MKKKILIFTLFVFISVVLIYFNSKRLENVFDSLIVNKIDDVENIDTYKFHIINQRYYSLLASLSFSGSKFPYKTIYDMNNNEPFQYSLKGKNIVVLLSNAGCNPCQIRELKNIDSLYQKKYNKVKITIIYDGMNKKEPLYLKKLSQTKFKFYYTKGNAYNDFNFTKKYPIVFFINDSIILSSLIAITGDDLFSSHFYKIISKKIIP